MEVRDRSERTARVNRQTRLVLGFALGLLGLGLALGLSGYWVWALFVWLLPLQALIAALLIYSILALVAFIWGRLHRPVR